MKRLLIAAVGTVLLAPATASAYHSSNDSGNAAGAVSSSRISKSIAKTNQYEGRVDPNTCSATQTFAVGGPARISVLTAGTNAGGFLYTQVIGRGGDVGADTYDANAAGTYGFRVCFRSDDGIDDATISYVSMIVLSPR
jgi:hypothetical protein